MREPYDILRHPSVTEKATALSEKSQYVFRVAPDATKQEIRYAVRQVFKKNVVRVNTMNVTGKKVRERYVSAGKKPNWKKAIVTLKAGETIDLV
ncbi:MAG: 50S ribosomal protein L23 [Verrucomicrobiota bacterium]